MTTRTPGPATAARLSRSFAKTALVCGVLTASFLISARVSQAQAAEDLAVALKGLGSTETEQVVKAVEALGLRADAGALPALEALDDDRLKVAADGTLYIENEKTHALTRASDGAAVEKPAGDLRSAEMNNEIRRVILPVIAQLRLAAQDPAIRLRAAEELSQQRGDTSAEPLLRQALARETDKKVKALLSLAVARLDLASPDAAKRISALQMLRTFGLSSAKSDIEALLKTGADGAFVEKDPLVRSAAQAALSSIHNREFMIGMAGHLIHGLSLASVFLFAALGLAITFGVMGVINMAHGEMLTVGAYTTYVVQVICAKSAPGLLPFYPFLAIPAAFAAALITGVLLERTVIRWLYGRPLETLLATWGISLGIIQTIRLIFGASNVTVANPGWLSGGYELFDGLVLPYSRLAVIAFVVVAAIFVWFVLQRTRLGLEVRAVTQNRAMAACMGVRTKRVDMWTFGIGSGIAGLGGVALSQLGNVGPELGQNYILDSFMVVVLGGVGRIAGTVVAALGLGIVQKLIEPLSGAVMGKIAVLVFIILFIQRRPQGMFAPRGRIEA